MCLRTRPPAVRSGYVHLVSLRTGHLYASVPTDVWEKVKCERAAHIKGCIQIASHSAQITRFIFFFLAVWTCHSPEMTCMPKECQQRWYTQHGAAYGNKHWGWCVVEVTKPVSRGQRGKPGKCVTMAFCGAMAATSGQRCVWMWSRSQEWWDYNTNGFEETGGISPQYSQYSNILLFLHWVFQVYQVYQATPCQCRIVKIVEVKWRNVAWVQIWLFSWRSYRIKHRIVSY